MSSGVGSSLACTAAWTGLYFRPDGFVTPCCTSWHLLGRVTGPERRSLRDIWSGERARALRSALEAADFGLGCWECGRAAAGGNRASSLAATFDRFDPTREQFPQLLDFALSNRCNLMCVMCNGGLSSAIRHKEGRPALPAAYDDRFFDELQEFLPHARRTQFKGGEPFLARENWRVWELLSDLGGDHPEVAVTTNGTVWSAAVQDCVRSLDMDVNISVDAMDPDMLRSIRVGVDPIKLWRNVDRFQDAVGDRRLTLSFCLMRQNWSELAPFLAEVDRRGATANVIWVDGPGDVNLLMMPLPELREALDGVKDQLRRTTGLSDASREILDDARTRLTQRLQGITEENVVPVRISDRHERTAAALRSELLELCPSGLVEVRYEKYLVASVSVPEWGRWIGPDVWAGTGLEQVPTILAESSGHMLRSDVEPIGPGVHRMELRLLGPRNTELVGIHAPLNEDGTESVLLLAMVSGD